MEHSGCVHYRYVNGHMIVVSRDEWYDYCTNQASDDYWESSGQAKGQEEKS